MKQPIRTAIVGLGNIAWLYDIENKPEPNDGAKTHVFTILKNPKTKLVAGCDSSPQRRESFTGFLGVPTFEDISEMLTTESPQMLSICSPSETHFEHCRQALLFPSIEMIWLEKPPATNLEHVDELCQLATNSGKTVLVNFNRRYSPIYQRLKSFIDNKSFGEVAGVHITYSRGLLNNGSHMLDLLSFLASDDQTFSLQYVVKDQEFSAILSHQKLKFVHLQGLNLTYHCLDISVTFDRGRVSVNGGGHQLKVDKKVENKNFRGFYHLLPQNDETMIVEGNVSFLNRALDDLIESNRKKILPQSSLFSARTSLLLMEKLSE